MSLNDMLAKNSPIGDKRKTSESEYLRLLGRNTEFVDKIKWLERDNKELQERIDKAIEYIKQEINGDYLLSDYDSEVRTKDLYIFPELLEILKGSDKE